MISAIEQNLRSEVAAIEYRVDGERSAAAVANGKTQLLGVAIVTRNGASYHQPPDIVAALARLGDRPRVYDDAVFSRAVERHCILPTAENFDDVDIMARLLGRERMMNFNGNSEANGRHNPGDHAIQKCHSMLVLLDHLANELSRAGMGYLYARIELPVVNPTVDMTIGGIPVDVNKLHEKEIGAHTQSDILRMQIAEVAGNDLNPNSPEQLREYLFGQCGLLVNTTEDSESTLDSVLERHEHQHSLIPLLRKYRKIQPVLFGCQSLLSRSLIIPSVHPKIDPLGACTGRFTCQDPPLQSLSAQVQDAICARDGHRLIEIDFSQAELRVLAHFSRDPGLVDALTSPRGDVHRQTAAIALGKPPDNVTPDERERVGKTTNFAVIYGQTKYGLSETLGIPAHEAELFIDAYFRAYPGVRGWRDKAIQTAHETGEVKTLYGRRRILTGINSNFPPSVRAAERQAINTIIQGTAADILKLAIARLYGQLPTSCRLLLTVHDSFLLEVPEKLAHEVARNFLRVVEEPPPNFTMPIRAKMKFGRTWAECKSDESLPSQSLIYPTRVCGVRPQLGS